MLRRLGCRGSKGATPPEQPLRRARTSGARHGCSQSLPPTANRPSAAGTLLSSFDGSHVVKDELISKATGVGSREEKVLRLPEHQQSLPAAPMQGISTLAEGLLLASVAEQQRSPTFGTAGDAKLSRAGSEPPPKALSLHKATEEDDAGYTPTFTEVGFAKALGPSGGCSSAAPAASWWPPKQFIGSRPFASCTTLLCTGAVDAGEWHLQEDMPNKAPEDATPGHKGGSDAR